MRIAFDILIAIIFLVFLATPKINFKPFSINFETPLLSFAFLFLGISIILLQIHSEQIGHKKGYEKAVKNCIEIIKNS